MSFDMNNVLDAQTEAALGRALAAVEVACLGCSGTGHLPVSNDWNDCADCKGTGRVKRWPNGLADWYAQHGEKVCGTCGGSGQFANIPSDMSLSAKMGTCPTCHGAGRERGVERLYRLVKARPVYAETGTLHGSYSDYDRYVPVTDVYTALMMLRDCGVDVTYVDGQWWHTRGTGDELGPFDEPPIAQVLAAEGAR